MKVRFKAFDAGPRQFKFKIPLQSNEEIAQNNARDRLVDVVDRTRSILYLEGEPRPEPKFIRLATEKDDNLRIALLQRTADRHVERARQVPAARPRGTATSCRKAFRRRARSCSSTAASSSDPWRPSAFSPEQQRMLEDFVDVRGGGLIMLGGPHSFAEGGWGGTPLSNALPVVLDRGAHEPIVPAHRRRREADAGAARAIRRRRSPTRRKRPAAKWRDLPPLTTVNNVADVKPGATVLLEGLPSRGRDQVVLAYQRYGRGKALALPVEDTWLWRMHVKMDVEGRDALHVLAAAGALARGRRAGSRDGVVARRSNCSAASR